MVGGTVCPLPTNVYCHSCHADMTVRKDDSLKCVWAAMESESARLALRQCLIANWRRNMGLRLLEMCTKHASHLGLLLGLVIIQHLGGKQPAPDFLLSRTSGLSEHLSRHHHNEGEETLLVFLAFSFQGVVDCVHAVSLSFVSCSGGGL